MSPGPALPSGIEVRRHERRDGSVTETFTVRWKEPDGSRRRRSFDSPTDAVDFQAKRRSAKRWRPEELRQEQGGRQTLGAFFEQWWMDHAIVELKRSTLAAYRCCGRPTPSRGWAACRCARSTPAAS
jgi:hypothetical protein